MANLKLLDERALGTDYLPASVFFHVNVGVTNPAVKRLALVVASFEVIDARHDASVPFNSHLHVRGNGGIKCLFPVFDVGDIIGPGVELSGGAADAEIVISKVPLKPGSITSLVRKAS